MKKNKHGFTLIELIAVLVILAILALVAVPIVLNIVKLSKKKADQRSVDAYGKAVEIALSNYLLETGKKTNSMNDLKIEYSGNKVVCNVSEVYQNNVFLSECSVAGKEVKDSKTSDGYYHYGDSTKFVDLYGKSVESAINRYYKDKKAYPNNISELALNDVNENVSCDTVRINTKGNLYLSNCSIKNIKITNDKTQDGYYHYGENKYAVGDKIVYKNMGFYVVEDSDESKDSIHLMKGDALKKDEVDLSGTEIAEKVANASYGEYISSAYVYSDSCTSFAQATGNLRCSTDYDMSSVKQIIDAWVNTTFTNNELVNDKLGYKARLLTMDDLMDNLGYNNATVSGTMYIPFLEYTPEMMLKYRGWTMSAYMDDNTAMWYITNAKIDKYTLWSSLNITPIINIKKSVIGEVIK